MNPTISCNALAIYGYHPPSITSSLRENSKVKSMEDQIEHQKQFLQLLNDNLTLVHNQMKQHAYQHRSEISFGYFYYYNHTRKFPSSKLRRI